MAIGTLPRTCISYFYDINKYRLFCFAVGIYRAEKDLYGLVETFRGPTFCFSWKAAIPAQLYTRQCRIPCIIMSIELWSYSRSLVKTPLHSTSLTAHVQIMLCGGSKSMHDTISSMILCTCSTCSSNMYNQLALQQALQLLCIRASQPRTHAVPNIRQHCH